MVTKALALLAVAVSALWLVGPLHPAPVEATSHRAVRSFSASSVLPGGRLEVTITPTGYGSFGQVVETLPSGFSYARSSLAATQVAVEGRAVTFTLFGESDFRYTVTAPSAEGSYAFSGVIKDDEQSGGIGLRRFHDTGWPAPYADAHTDADAHPNADTHAHADTDAHAQHPPHTHSYADAHTDADSYAHAHSHPYADTHADPDTDTHADPYAHAYADPRSHSAAAFG